MISENMFLQNIHFSNVIYKGTAIFYKATYGERLMISIVLHHHSAPSFRTIILRHHSAPTMSATVFMRT